MNRRCDRCHWYVRLGYHCITLHWNRQSNGQAEPLTSSNSIARLLRVPVIDFNHFRKPTGPRLTTTNHGKRSRRMIRCDKWFLLLSCRSVCLTDLLPERVSVPSLRPLGDTKHLRVSCSAKHESRSEMHKQMETKRLTLCQYQGRLIIQRWGSFVVRPTT